MQIMYHFPKIKQVRKNLHKKPVKTNFSDNNFQYFKMLFLTTKFIFNSTLHTNSKDNDLKKCGSIDKFLLTAVLSEILVLFLKSWFNYFFK